MKKILFIALFSFSVFNTTAQNWMTNIDQAKKIASEENKEIILVFQGSDWCAPCIKLEKEIWSTPEFISYAKEHYVMLKADFPRRKKNALSPEQQKQNNELAEKYNKNGYFPFVVVLNPQGEVLGETGYIKTSPENYISQLNSF